MEENLQWKIKTVPLRSWERFEFAINLKLKRSQGRVNLYRGQRDANWKLETTLERFAKDNDLKSEYSWKDYYDIVKSIKPTITSLTNKNYDDPYNSPNVPKEYPLMVYLRHHNFPSPLLDWSQSPYVAAFFAFRNAIKVDKVAIYSFNSWPKPIDQERRFENGMSYIERLGPNMITNKRHFQQQSEYTICYKKINDTQIYSRYEDVNFNRKDAVIRKYTVPASERKKVLAKLDLMNINSYTLFGNDEGLMDFLAYKYLERNKLI